MSPESITEKVYSERTDVWSFGIFLVELLSESQPYGKLTPMKVAMHNSKKSPLGSILKLGKFVTFFHFYFFCTNIFKQT